MQPVIRLVEIFVSICRNYERKCYTFHSMNCYMYFQKNDENDDSDADGDGDATEVKSKLVFCCFFLFVCLASASWLFIGCVFRCITLFILSNPACFIFHHFKGARSILY